MNQSENIIPASEHAKQIGKTAQTVRRWIQEGKIKGEKKGSRWFVVLNDQANSQSTPQKGVPTQHETPQKSVKRNAQSQRNEEVRVRLLEIDSINDFEDYIVGLDEDLTLTLHGTIAWADDPQVEPLDEFSPFQLKALPLYCQIKRRFPLHLTFVIAVYDQSRKYIGSSPGFFHDKENERLGDMLINADEDNWEEDDEGDWNGDDE